jgi:heme A synthase
MENGVQYEHTHRLVATAVGLLTIALAVVLHRRRREDPVTAKMGYLGVGLVCFQGLLGGITVLLRLPILVTLAHLGTSMAFFCLMTLIVVRVRRPASRPSPQVTRVTRVARVAQVAQVAQVEAKEKEALVGLRPWAAVAAVATFLQIVLGGIVRHTASGLACFGIPFCNGDVWPSHPGAHWHMGHRFFGVALGALVIGLAMSVRRRAPSSRVARLAGAAMVLVLVQITLGALSVLSMLALSAVTLHLGVAALLLACNVSILYYLHPIRARESYGSFELSFPPAW